MLLNQTPELLILNLSHVPAPINTVHTQAAPAGNWPITVLLAPVVIAHPAHVPIAMLLQPVVFAQSAAHPIATLTCPVVLFLRAHEPIAML